jgi:hypothetical protein
LRYPPSCCREIPQARRSWCDGGVAAGALAVESRDRATVRVDTRVARRAGVKETQCARIVEGRMIRGAAVVKNVTPRLSIVMVAAPPSAVS